MPVRAVALVRSLRILRILPDSVLYRAVWICESEVLEGQQTAVGILEAIMGCVSSLPI